MLLSLEQIIERGQISVICTAALNASMGQTKEHYAPYVATSWTPRQESAEGNTPREAVEALLKKLDMI